MPTNDERRRIAETLRSGVGTTDYKSDGAFIEWLFSVISRSCDGHILDPLADLIEPEERTCYMVRDDLTDTVYCDVCGERFDSVAQYMAMVQLPYSVTDYEPEYKNARYCPNCGAKVVGE